MCADALFLMENTYYGELSVIGMPGCEKFVEEVDSYLHEWRGSRGSTSYIVAPECKRFGNGEGKAVLHESMRGHDVYIIADMYNYSVRYKMYGTEYPMSPDDHFADLKRVINAIAGKARRITVIMPMLYESRQDKRPMLSDLRESGSLEQDADIVMFLYREDYYDKDTEHKNQTEVIIAKHRNGPVDTVNLYFQKEYTKFRDMVHE